MVKNIHIDLKVSGETIQEDLIEEWIKDCLYNHGVKCIISEEKSSIHNKKYIKQ
jgi:hypothetical protein